MAVLIVVRKGGVKEDLVSSQSQIFYCRIFGRFFSIYFIVNSIDCEKKNHLKITSAPLHTNSETDATVLQRLIYGCEGGPENFPLPSPDTDLILLIIFFKFTKLIR